MTLTRTFLHLLPRSEASRGQWALRIAAAIALAGLIACGVPQSAWDEMPTSRGLFDG